MKTPKSMLVTLGRSPRRQRKQHASAQFGQPSMACLVSGSPLVQELVANEWFGPGSYCAFAGNGAHPASQANPAKPNMNRTIIAHPLPMPRQS
jgi:hypothetical protein